jgi:hypothetical protein
MGGTQPKETPQLPSISIDVASPYGTHRIRPEPSSSPSCHLILQLLYLRAISPKPIASFYSETQTRTIPQNRLQSRLSKDSRLPGSPPGIGIKVQLLPPLHHCGLLYPLSRKMIESLTESQMIMEAALARDNQSRLQLLHNHRLQPRRVTR